MALFDIFKRDKHRKAEQRLQRPSKGVLKRAEKPKTVKSPSFAKATEGKETTASKSDIASYTILAPHVTEKTTLLSEKNVYVFKVSKRTNKIMVKQSIKEMYGFSPKKISIVNVSSKKRSSRGHVGRKPGYKKAMIYLKEGDKIEVA